MLGFISFRPTALGIYRTDGVDSFVVVDAAAPDQALDTDATL
ncbi:MAG: hypothetical protein Q7S71_03825 [Candidatus Nitrotoga sp.]|nr:hypothetical protein [Candidatus Nitrotoga sp.]